MRTLKESNFCNFYPQYADYAPMSGCKVFDKDGFNRFELPCQKPLVLEKIFLKWS